MQAFDEHLNMVLGDVEEKHITQITDAAGAASFKVRNATADGSAAARNRQWMAAAYLTLRWLARSRCLQEETRSFPMLFLRGDSVILVTPPLRTA
jgi:small nuclear ribonucleoprotein (snRNP)-like protein